MKISADFVTSAADAAALPRDGLPQVAIVGRSNVGKSSLINALVRRKLARTSAAPGKTRLANVYRVQRGTAGAVYLVDLPGFGYARGGSDDFERLAAGVVERVGAAILLVDARHPGLENDRAAWGWLVATVDRRAVVGTKVDKLARGERIRALKALESVFEDPVLPCSAVTGEGLDELWKLIDRLAKPSSNSRSRRSSPPPAGTAPLPSKVEGPRR